MPRIGKHQDAVLNALRMIGPWRPGADNVWNYGSPVLTARILERLAERGLAEVREDGSYSTR